MTTPFEAHIARMAEIQQQGIDFTKRASEAHVEVVERKILPGYQIGDKLVSAETKPAGKDAPEGIS